MHLRVVVNTVFNSRRLPIVNVAQYSCTVIKTTTCKVLMTGTDVGRSIFDVLSLLELELCCILFLHVWIELLLLCKGMLLSFVPVSELLTRNFIFLLELILEEAVLSLLLHLRLNLEVALSCSRGNYEVLVGWLLRLKILVNFSGTYLLLKI